MNIGKSTPFTNSFDLLLMPSLFFRCVRDTVMELLADEKYLGALPGLLLSLHTWGRTLPLHPHMHSLVDDRESIGWHRVKRYALNLVHLLPCELSTGRYRQRGFHFHYLL